jgi:SAM-dependent methyltransferase
MEASYHRAANDLGKSLMQWGERIMGDSTVTYDPRIFVCRTSEEARQIILTPEVGLSTNERWERETAYLSEMIIWPDDARLVIDYGCGIGRMMRNTRPSVLGVDISPSMRAHGEAYLTMDGARARDDRTACGFISPDCLELLIERGLRAQGAMAIWTLQHTLDPRACIRTIFNALLPGAPFYVVDRGRLIPALQDGNFAWVSDGVDIGQAVEAGGFVLVHEEPMPTTLCAAGAWFRAYERAAI